MGKSSFFIFFHAMKAWNGRIFNRNFIVYLFLPLLTICTACANNIGSNSSVQSEFVLGTFCSIDLFERKDTALYRRLFDRLAELEMIFSANREDSELAKINRNAGLEPVEISQELFTVLERSLYFAEATEGLFDPTVGPLVKLWGIGTENERIPAKNEIEAALSLINYREVELIRANNEALSSKYGTAFLKRTGMALDLGAIAKGYAADALVSILKEAGIEKALIDLGGNLYVWGKKGDGEYWNIAVQDPLSARGSYAGILNLEGSVSVVSSGVYERFFVGDNGKKYHHILDLSGNGGEPGYPVESSILSTTVIAASSMDADVLSTSCFILGYDKGLALAQKSSAEIIYIEENASGEIIVRGSPGAMAVFIQADMTVP